MTSGVAYSINQVARMAGVTSRTLRHYDEIGLLTPARVAANGYRWYDRPQLFRLQRILLLRGLGLSLAAIAATIAGDGDEVTALRDHRAQLVAERERLDEIIDTVDRTIANLAGEQSEDFLRGLARARRRLGDGLRARYGDRAADQVAAHDWTREQQEQAAEQGRELLTRMARARAGGVTPTEPAAQALTAEHYRQVRAVWPADAAAYHALGDLIVGNPEQRAMVAAVDPDLPEWLAAAVQAYADRL
ncbi:MerR family transcriptional regulator [Actinoplanes ianthinogenes]|uniref:MerR family transcriptional regulator n=1 Tax=Actinoplanes ianthinogenes TaxID=122358 RepID=A0ABN6CSZ6_9ACTN|nr:MerR family transcriptional regulator [Actinoplanes ianthinogenes]BCJ48386.1 MerR family transcriptional regulator [Actinoplanes ianthinogenes]GGR46737.1 MerR family transcriptional regulator [Actinoplanes ianthinogenes]